MTYFDPKCNKYPYLEDTGIHYLKVKKDRGIIFDKDYPYIDTSKQFVRKRRLFRILVFLLGFPVSAIRMGLRVKGKKNLKKYKDVINKGIISVCNHVHMWDYLSIMNAIKPYKPYYLAWDKNVNGENGSLIRLTGGIPVPVNNIRATAAYVKAINNHLNNSGWLHIYAEGAMWEYYAKIRPFKQGAFYFSYKNNKPILPMAYSYRPCGFIRKKIFKQIAKFTLHIGEPIYPNMELKQDESIKDLTIRVHQELVKLAGVENNLYEPIYDENTCKRIDYYTTEYGVGYKGSK